MAKKRRARRFVSSSTNLTDYVPSGKRDRSSIASGWAEPSGPSLSFPEFFQIPRSGLSNLEIEDRRFFHPDRYRPAAGLRRTRHRLDTVSLNAMGAKRPPSAAKRSARGPDLMRRASAVPIQVRFRGAPHVLVCMRRHRRREVMFAKGHGGKRPKRRPRRNQYSSVSCR